MDELEKGLSIALKPAAAKPHLEAFKRQIKKWDIAMPRVKPLVLDFGLGEFNKTGLIEYWIANEAKQGYCGKYLFVFDGQTCPEHRHQKKHETFLILKGKVRMRINGRARILKEGAVLPVSTSHKHSFTGIGPALLVELSMPCEIDDNCFSDGRIPIGAGARRK